MNLDFPEKEVLEGEGEPGQEAVSDRDLVVEPQGVVEDVHLESRVVVDVSKGTEERVRLSVFAKPEVLHEESIDRRGIILARREIEVLERHARRSGVAAPGVYIRCDRITPHREEDADTSADLEGHPSGIGSFEHPLGLVEEFIDGHADLRHDPQPVTNRWLASSPSRRSRTTPCRFPLK